MRNKSEAEVEAEAEPETLTLKCPSCPNDNPRRFEHWETVDCSRTIYGFTDRGELEIGDADYGDSDNEKLYCMDCCHMFPVPNHLDISWI